MLIDLTPDFSLLAIMVIFLINLLVVRRFLIRPIIGVLDWRENEIAGSARRYEESLVQFNEATADMEDRLHAARREGTEIREQRRAEAAAHRAELVARMRNEAEAMIREADEQLTREVGSARERIVRESEELARLAAERILGRKLAS